MHFSSFGTTINSQVIVDAITQHGIPIFQTSELHLKPFLCQDSACNLADIIAVYKQSKRFYIVGIEIKGTEVITMNHRNSRSLWCILHLNRYTPQLC